MSQTRTVTTGRPTSHSSATEPAEPSHPAFVLHDHRHPQHHFDLRLEEGGVLRSWALPKGLPTRSTENRLAVEVADHDLEHLTYTYADKSIADTGWWEEHDRNERRFVFTLHGRHDAIRYALISTSTDWLLHRMKEQPLAGNSGANET
jgi:DNA ligase D-like protein (predicted 3'-phosphoesterase)